MQAWLNLPGKIIRYIKNGQTFFKPKNEGWLSTWTLDKSNQAHLFY